MSFNENLENMVSAVSNMQEVSAKYADHESKNASQIVYHEPADAKQASIAAAVRRKTAALFIVGAVVFTAFTVFAFVTGQSITAALVMAVLSAVLIFTVFRILSGTPQVMTGIAVFKYERIGSGSGTGKNTARTYLISVKPDSGERVIYKNIQISQKDYAKVAEGTPVLVVKTGATAQACIL